MARTSNIQNNKDLLLNELSEAVQIMSGYTLHTTYTREPWRWRFLRVKGPLHLTKIVWLILPLSTLYYVELIIALTKNFASGDKVNLIIQGYCWVSLFSCSLKFWKVRATLASLKRKRREMGPITCYGPIIPHIIFTPGLIVCHTCKPSWWYNLQ